MKMRIAQILKQCRTSRGFTAENVTTQLENYGIKLSHVTLYGYENGHAQPNADTFLCLCKIYGITDFSIFFDEKIDTAPVPNNYNRLNDLGKQKADEYINDLSENKKYTASDDKAKLTNVFDDIAEELSRATGKNASPTKQG